MEELTTNDIINLQTVAVNRVAKCLGVSINNKSFTEVYSEISDIDDPLFSLLRDFIVAYRQYQNHHIYHDEKLRKLEEFSELDDERLIKFMEARDKSRRALIKALMNNNC